jgi:REP element-mobilizing transposase RayT
MPQSFVKICIHLTFSTKHRLPMIDEKIKDELWAYLGGICNSLECIPISIGGFNDHIHLCCFLSKKLSVVKFVEEVKKQSSRWIKTKGTRYSNFYWQEGYGVFSVNPSELDVVKKYIESQAEHHQKKTYQDELRAFLKKYNIDYDEKYVWD